MSGSQYNSYFNQPVHGAVIGEHNTVTINISSPPLSPSLSPFAFRSIIGIPPPTDSRTIQQRASLVETIHTKLNEPGLNALVLTGIGGVGKSTLAALVYRYAEAHQNVGLFTAPSLWLTIDPYVTFADLIGTIYRALDKPLPSLASLSFANQAQALFNALAITKSNRLIVLDQFENFLDWNTGAALLDHQEIGAWLDALNSQPFRTGCRLLLTSRSRPKGSHEYPIVHFLECPVDGLTTTEGTKLLREQGVQAPETELHKVVDGCSGHALSLILLIALVQDYQMPLTALLDDPAHWGDDIATHLLDAIFTRLNDIQRDLLRAFSVYSTPVPIEVVLSQMEPVEQKLAFQALRTLLTQHLIQPVGEGRYQLHIIVANYVKQHFVEGDAQANQHEVQRAQTKANRYQNRQRMLARVRMFWINGVLEQSLRGVALISLGLIERRDILAGPWVITPQRQEQTSHTLPEAIRITEVFDEASGELLILGEPGSGKTTLLLELARDLLNRAEQDESYPIPVIFNLSSWAMKRQPLVDWLIEELNTKYWVPRKLGKDWVSADQVLLLLDGLDEVPAEACTACMQAINHYREEHSLVSIVVCSRRAEYMTQKIRVQLNKAVMIQSLTMEQIDAYLVSVGKQVEPVRLMLREDPDLQELTKTPLMLRVLTLVFYGMPIEDILAVSSSEMRGQQVFAAYVQRMLLRRGISKRFTSQQAPRWLAWLARQNERHSQAVFYIERIQMDWLPERRLGRLFSSIVVGLVYGLFFGLVKGIDYGFLQGADLYGRALNPARGFIDGLLIGALNALLFALLNGFIFGIVSKPEIERETSSTTKSWERTVINVLEKGPVYGLLMGLFNGVLIGWLVDPPAGIYNGLFISIIYAVLGKLDTEIKPAEIVTWSWKSVRQNAIKFVGGGALLGFFYGSLTVLSMISKLSSHVLSGTIFLPTLIFGLSIGLVVGLIALLIRGLSYDELDKTDILKPNQGIWNSARNSAFLGLLCFVLFGFFFSVIYTVILQQVFQLYGVTYAEYASFFPSFKGLSIGLSYGLAVGAFFWIRSGGTACIQHVVLRILLWRSKCIPWNYPDFLNGMAERLLLHKVGGGYIFIHRLLQEYFASLAKEKK